MPSRSTVSWSRRRRRLTDCFQSNKQKLISKENFAPFILLTFDEFCSVWSEHKNHSQKEDGETRGEIRTPGLTTGPPGARKVTAKPLRLSCPFTTSSKLTKGLRQHTVAPPVVTQRTRTKDGQ